MWGGGGVEGEGGRELPQKKVKGILVLFRDFLIGDFNQCFRCYGTP